MRLARYFTHILIGSVAAGLLLVILRDVPPLTYAIWTVPFAVLSAGLVRLLDRAILATPRGFKYVAAPLFGAVVSFVYVGIVVYFLGPWASNFGPVAIAWFVGGATGMASIVSWRCTDRPYRLTPSLRAILMLFAVSVGATLLAPPAIGYASGYRDPDMVFVRWDPGSDPLRIDDVLGLLNEDEKVRLQALGLTGVLSVQSRATLESALVSVSITLVVQEPVDSPILLPFPTSGSIAYVQFDDHWAKFPESTQTTSKGVELFQATPESLRFRVESLGGSYSEGWGLDWE